jgi:hypothetical protein
MQKINQNSNKRNTDNGQRNQWHEFSNNVLGSHSLDYYENLAIEEEISTLVGDDLTSCKDETEENSKKQSQVLTCSITCSRVGEKHWFTSNETARDFGVAIQDHFKQKADMSNVMWRFPWISMIMKSLWALHWLKRVSTSEIPLSLDLQRSTAAQALCPSIYWNDWRCSVLNRQY